MRGALRVTIYTNITYRMYTLYNIVQCIVLMGPSPTQQSHYQMHGCTVCTARAIRCISTCHAAAAAEDDVVPPAPVAPPAADAAAAATATPALDEAPSPGFPDLLARGRSGRMMLSHGPV